MTTIAEPFRAHVYWQLERLYRDLAEAGTPLTQKRRSCLEGVLVGYSYEQIAAYLAPREDWQGSKKNNLYKVKNRVEHTRLVLEQFFLCTFERAEDIALVLKQRGYAQTVWSYLLGEASPCESIAIQHLERGPHIASSLNAPITPEAALPRVIQHAPIRLELKPHLPFVVLLSGDTAGKIWSLSPSPISPEVPFRPDACVQLPKFKDQSLWFADVGVETLLLIESGDDLELTRDWQVKGQTLYNLQQASKDLDRLSETVYMSQREGVEVRLSTMQFEVVPKA